MRLIELSNFWTIVLDCVAWFIIHMTCALVTLKMPDRFFSKDAWLYSEFIWENNGKIWQKLFRIRKWKDYLPDGGALFKSGFSKKKIQSRDRNYYEKFILESKRGELSHWLAILPAPLFFLWNPFWVGWIMIVYALLVNAPCIIAQRYNRPRFKRVLRNSSSII